MKKFVEVAFSVIDFTMPPNFLTRITNLQLPNVTYSQAEYCTLPLFGLLAGRLDALWSTTLKEANEEKNPNTLLPIFEEKMKADKVWEAVEFIQSNDYLFSLY